MTPGRTRQTRRASRQVGSLALHFMRTVFGLIALVLSLVVFAPASTAQAATGDPAGWAVERATAKVVVGRAVLHYEPGLEDEALALAQEIPGLWSDVERSLAIDLDDRLQITYLTHAGRVAEATGMPHWVAGVAHPSSGEIMISRYGPDGAPSNVTAVLKHEMAHVALHRATDGAPVPRWFHEGVAESFEDNVSLARAQALANLVFGAGVPDLGELEASFHGNEGRDAAVAYAAARDLVTFLRFRDGTGDDLRQLLTELRLGHGFEASFIRAYGHSLPELVSEWRQGLPGRFVWFPLIAGGGMPLVLLVPVMVMAWIRRRRKAAAGWARLEREEERLRRQLDLSSIAASGRFAGGFVSGSPRRSDPS